jgi:hypothetical protein
VEYSSSNTIQKNMTVALEGADHDGYPVGTLPMLTVKRNGPSPKEVSLLAVKKPRKVIEFHQYD